MPCGIFLNFDKIYTKIKISSIFSKLIDLYDLKIFYYIWIYAEVEIPVASNLRPLCDKTFVASNQ